jgi:hypothetical protein
MGLERGQATVEWTALVLLVALVVGGLVAAGVHVDGRSFGGLLVHRIVCAAQGGCDDGRAALAAAYGERDAALVRAYAPSIVYERGTFALPIDFRRCRSHRCADAPDDRDLDVHRSARGGLPATAFTHVVHRGGETFIQYWLYYPDSVTTLGGLKGAWSRAGGGRLPFGLEHRDDWESYQVRIDPEGHARSRASSHRGHTSCKQHPCEGTWLPVTGWTRVSRGSHSGHVPWSVELEWGRDPLHASGARGRRPLYPGLDMRERTSTAARLRLVPLETLDRRGYERLDPGISPPWEKRVYRDPTARGTS